MEQRSKTYSAALKFLLILGLLLNSSESAKILSIFGYPGPSQYIMASALLKTLAERGHEVTSISVFPQKVQLKNFRDIPVMENANVFEPILTETVSEAEEPGYFETLRGFAIAGTTMVNNILNNTQVKYIMQNEKFDLILIEVLLSEGLFGLAEHFNAPIVGVSTMGTAHYVDAVVGNPTPLSYVPNMELPYGNHMSLMERLYNVVFTVVDQLFYEYVLLPTQQKLYEKYFPQAELAFSEARKNVSLVLLNTHFSLAAPRPYVTNMIEVGGLHIKQKPDPLPTDMQQFLDNATEGAIYFSMGSNLKSRDFPAETLQIFLKCFAELKQKVLWKFEDYSLPNLPKNVFIKKWYPQPSILAHPNVKLFISHGGLLSTTESIFHAKPILGIPVFADQPMNVRNAVRSGYALSLDLSTMTEESLSKTIKELLENPRFTNRVQTLSKRLRDQPMTPMETAVFWIEYVLRHNGAHHLRNAGQDLSVLEYHNIDVWLVIIGSLAINLVVIYYIFILLKIKIFRHFCGSKRKLSKNSIKVKRS